MWQHHAFVKRDREALSTPGIMNFAVVGAPSDNPNPTPADQNSMDGTEHEL